MITTSSTIVYYSLELYIIISYNNDKIFYICIYLLKNLII